MDEITKPDFLYKDQQWFYEDESTIFTDELITDICEQLDEECLENTLFIVQKYQ